MITILKFLFILVILAGIGLVGFAYLGDLSPVQEDVVTPIILHAD